MSKFSVGLLADGEHREQSHTDIMQWVLSDVLTSDSEIESLLEAADWWHPLHITDVLEAIHIHCNATGVMYSPATKLVNSLWRHASESSDIRSVTSAYLALSWENPKLCFKEGARALRKYASVESNDLAAFTAVYQGWARAVSALGGEFVNRAAHITREPQVSLMLEQIERKE